MDLVCCEDGELQNSAGKTVYGGVRAGSDPALIWDHRALHSLTALEKTNQISPYFGTVQTDIQPYMRRILAEWMLQQWEVAVVSRLDWCLASVLPSDFLEPILHAIPFVHPHHLHKMRRHVHSYIALAAIDYKFSVFLPSTIACACVGVAMHRLKLPDGTISTDLVMKLLANLLVTDLTSIQLCYDQLGSVLELSLPSFPGCCCLQMGSTQPNDQLHTQSHSGCSVDTCDITPGKQALKLLPSMNG